jgi:nucleotide-binding universal stress UspA family protein
MYDCILVATDDSRLARKAEKSAIDLAAATGARLVVLHVVPDYPMSHFDGMVAIPPQEVARIEGRVHAGGQAVLDRVVQVAARQGVQARGVLAQSDHVADAVLRAARKHRCDLIVLASHGRRGLQRLLLGSETHKVLAGSPLPVLVLR